MLDFSAAAGTQLRPVDVASAVLDLVLIDTRASALLVVDENTSSRVLDELRQRGHDIVGLRAAHRLVCIDPETLCDSIIVREQFDTKRFIDALGDVLIQEGDGSSGARDTWVLCGLARALDQRGLKIGTSDMTAAWKMAAGVQRINLMQDHDSHAACAAMVKTLLDAVRQMRTRDQSLEAAVAEARRDERRSLGRRLHDGLGQILTGAALGLATVDRDLVVPSVRSQLARISDLLMEASRTVTAFTRPEKQDASTRG